MGGSWQSLNLGAVVKFETNPHWKNCFRNATRIPFVSAKLTLQYCKSKEGNRESNSCSAPFGSWWWLQSDHNWDPCLLFESKKAHISWSLWNALLAFPAHQACRAAATNVVFKAFDLADTRMPENTYISVKNTYARWEFSGLHAPSTW